MPVATGTVTFYDGSSPIGSAPVISNLATFTTSSLGLGSQNITAQYSGDPNFLGGVSSILTQTVGAVNSSTKLSSSQIHRISGKPSSLPRRFRATPERQPGP
jgi:hypothetical protein